MPASFPEARKALDTFANLPAVTAPLEALALDTRERLALPWAEAAAEAPSLAERWARWGAAREGARTTVTFSQVFGLLLLLWLAALLFAVDARLLLIIPMGLVTLLYVATGLHKLWLLARAAGASTALPAAPLSPASAEDADAALPRYTVLVPLRREGAMLSVLVRRLLDLDYPDDRLEVLLLVEADDDETHAAIARLDLPPHIRPLTVPRGAPRTKPRALNVGLARATGEYIVVYDAEDRPEPDQLRKAVAAFRTLPRRVVCLQARLGFYNPRQTWLTRLFVLDYAQWYHALLPGLTRTSACVPLGGTSNHFPTAVLRRIGGWDPYNVTEDCDLGIRIARAGLRVGMLESTTWEEAVTQPGAWVRQRSRWVKGYVQTYLVHMRQPLRLWRELRPAGFAHFQLLVGGSMLVLLLNPVMWAITGVYTLSAGSPVAAFIAQLFPPVIYYLGLLCLVAGNFLFWYLNLYVCLRQGYHDLARYALLGPLYWALMSLGAWLGLLDLLRHPHYWAKTSHGESLRLLGASEAAVVRSRRVWVRAASKSEGAAEPQEAGV